MIHFSPVILYEGQDEEARKSRLVTVYKDLVFKDITRITFKHVDASDNPNVVSRNAISADMDEKLDTEVITRYVEFRNAQLRQRLQKVLEEETVEAADDVLTPELPTYTYSLSLPESFADSTLRALAEYFHRFLVWGALYDWYNDLGMERQAAVYGRNLASIEDKITSALKGPSIQKRPMQPFGPAEKIV